MDEAISSLNDQVESRDIVENCTVSCVFHHVQPEWQLKLTISWNKYLTTGFVFNNSNI